MTTDDHGGKGREGGEEDVPCGTAASWRLRRICGTMGVFVRRPGAYITGRCKARSGRVWHTERWRFAREGGRVWHTDAVAVRARGWPGVAHRRGGGGADASVARCGTRTRRLAGESRRAAPRYGTSAPLPPTCGRVRREPGWLGRLARGVASGGVRWY